MNNNSTKKLVLYGLMIAMVYVTTYFTHITIIPPGYINLGDIFIMVAAILLGKNGGFAAGAIGSALADIASSSSIFAPVTFIVKGLEGYITGAIAYSSERESTVSYKRIITAVTIGAIVMVAGYFLAELYVLKLFDSTFGYSYAISELPGNILQGSVSSVIGYIIVGLLNRANIRKYIFH